jgi:hypothetical protein
LNMLKQFIEHSLITIFNRAGAGRRSRAVSSSPSALDLPPDYTILGHVLSPTESPTQDRIAARLNDSGIVALSPDARRRHLYILGATGTGKTNLLLRLIESDIQHQRAFCVIDLRGDLVDRILLRLAANAPPDAWRERLLLMDMRDNERVVGFNPLLGEGDVYNRALHLLAVLQRQAGSWGVQLEDTLRNCLFALAETGWSLLEIEPLLTNSSFRSQVLSQVSDTQVQSFFRRFNALSSANQITYTQAALNKITPLLSIPALRLTLGQRQSFSFRQLLDQQPGMIVLVALAVDRLHDAARLTGGMVVSSFQTAIMSRSDQPESERVPVHLYVDEFESMASDRFEAIVAEGRRFGLGLTLSHQNITQLSPNLRHVLRNNVHTQVYFQTGALDAAELAKEIGGGKGSDEVRAALMSQGVGQAYLVRRGQPSARIQVLHCPDPRVAPQHVQAIRSISADTYARSRTDVESELAERDRLFNNANAASTQTGTSASSQSPATYEIRHSRNTTFGPSRCGQNTNRGVSSTDAPTELSQDNAQRNESISPDTSTDSHAP